MFAVYLTHPQVLIDPAIPVPQWGLSDLGRERTIKTSQNPWLRHIRRVVSSDEVKAVETASILAEATGCAVEIAEHIGENDRSATGFLPPPEFEKAADWFFAHPQESFKGWERAVDAQARIVSAVETVLADHDPKIPILFVGHGGVGTLLKCHLAGRAIGRDADQPPGAGGNLYMFDLSTRRLACDWQKMELWSGPA
ncbi:broad specificity phosphatase PhoE [Rhizobium aquaticum]|uniref:Broad specificity phosphatase PhoE n=1 Tax=Rhizobium aquaticum TaxID=1549636 RepID=A0ABV2IY43_9HYPH